MRYDRLRRGIDTGCKRCKTPATKHGASGSPTWQSWVAMRARCERPTHSKYPEYGGRGIKVCDRWHEFTNFLADMGERPEGTTLDRKDPNGHYEPDNCRWATDIEQSNNRRRHHHLTHDGRTLTIGQWAREVGISQVIIRGRIVEGWSVEDALSLPVGMKRHQYALNRPDTISEA